MAVKSPLSFEDATAHYELWLAQQTTVVRADIAVKHAAIATDPFALLRGTFYRWLQHWPVICAAEARAPTVLAVGDLHVENFGTWRDLEGRLIWGVNDFDEACRLPYTNDLIRLATSAFLARHIGRLSMGRNAASDAILDGYSQALVAGGCPFVLEEEQHVLRALALSSLRDPRVFWPRLREGRRVLGELPPSARQALEALLPRPTP
jgi:uncharacterized protein (DUF2252 family)